ncbi:hypothetical protein SDC9_58943 [bioreactor metagenome]|uniref:Uncharacterized protein n=1 Tax=bioreactor metagenome TaxID=1076179 RepID=A0A644X942_9ZZZZ
MAMNTFPERDRRVYNLYEELKPNIQETKTICAIISEKILEEFKDKLSPDSVKRIYGREKDRVRIEYLESKLLAAGIEF